MSALATCTVVRKNRMKLDEPIREQGFEAEEESYEAHILFFENAKAYLIKDSSSTLHWVNIYQLINLSPIV